MISQYKGVFNTSKKATYLRWGLFLLLFVSTIFIPFMIATSGQTYPDLAIVPIFYAIAGFLWVPLLTEQLRQTTSVELADNHFVIKKFAQASKQFDYKAILAHNERLDFGKEDSFNVLTAYLKDDYFILKSNEFEDYELLKNQLCQHGRSVSYQRVMTLSERNRTRWMIGGLTLFIMANIAFGYVAHNPDDRNPAQLITFSDQVVRVSEDRPKGRLKGVIISLRSYPAFSFYVSRKNYDTPLDSLKWAFATRQPIELQIRESDYRKKLAETESLSVGDKYDNYRQVMVYGVKQGDFVRLQTNKPVYEPTHTNPGQRTFLLSILLLLCWTGWIYVDRHKVLRAG